MTDRHSSEYLCCFYFMQFFDWVLFLQLQWIILVFHSPEHNLFYVASSALNLHQSIVSVICLIYQSKYPIKQCQYFCANICYITKINDCKHKQEIFGLVLYTEHQWPLSCRNLLFTVDTFSHPQKTSFTRHPRTKTTHTNRSLCLCLFSVSLHSAACGRSGTPLSPQLFSRESHLSSKSSLASATLHQGWRLPSYQRCISWSDKALALVPAQQHPIINKSSRKEAFVTVYLDCFSSSPLISSSENWCTLRLKRRAWQVMVSVITAQISSARAFFFPFFFFFFFAHLF